MYNVTDVEITIDDVVAAQAGEAWAQELVLGTLAGNATKVATTHAYRWPGADTEDLIDEFRQVANVAMWGALDRFDGDSVDKFYGFMHRTAEYAVMDRFTEMRHPGADRESIQLFASCVRQCDGDIDLAEALCQSTKINTNRRLGKDRAHAARLAWSSAVSLDAPISGDDEFTLADFLVSKSDLPDELLTSDDLARQQRELRNELVNVVLDSMSEIMSTILKATFGVAPYGEYGVNAGEEIGALIGRTALNVKNYRSKAYKTFASKFIPLVTRDIEDPELMVQAQDDWWEAFHAERAR